jgi:hypothetical protein
MVCRAGAFMTVGYEKRLSDCVGSVERHERLIDVVVQCAGDVTTVPPRFPSLPVEDLVGARSCMVEA